MKRTPLIIKSALIGMSLIACEGQRPTWESQPSASPTAVEAALASDPYYPYFWDSHVDEETLSFPPPEHLRPCCVFGMDVKTQLVNFPVPMYRVANITQIKDIGPHVYDAGFRGRGSDDEVRSAEHNGLVYTCRGGFVDIAHIRDNADWTLFLASWVYRHLGEDIELVLKPELGQRSIMLRPFDASALGPVERLILSTSIGQYLAWQISIWHEIAQWHGYAVFDIFPEYPSAYSVEDLYSNILGINIAAALIYSGAVDSDKTYARHVDTWIKSTLKALQAQSREHGRVLTQALDQHWWDSTLRLPEKWVVRQRNYDARAKQQPPIFPESLRQSSADPRVQSICSDAQPPLTLHIKESILGYDLRKLARLRIHISHSAMPTFHFANESGERVTVEQDDFAEIIANDELTDVAEFEALQAAKAAPDQPGLLSEPIQWLENLAQPDSKPEPESEPEPE